MPIQQRRDVLIAALLTWVVAACTLTYIGAHHHRKEMLKTVDGVARAAESRADAVTAPAEKELNAPAAPAGQTAHEAAKAVAKAARDAAAEEAGAGELHLSTVAWSTAGALLAIGIGMGVSFAHLWQALWRDAALPAAHFGVLRLIVCEECEPRLHKAALALDAYQEACDVGSAATDPEACRHASHRSGVDGDRATTRSRQC